MFDMNVNRKFELFLFFLLIPNYNDYALNFFIFYVYYRIYRKMKYILSNIKDHGDIVVGGGTIINYYIFLLVVGTLLK